MPIVTLRDPVKIGRAGNQLFTYVFAKAYAEKMGFEFQCGNWFGKTIFVNAIEPDVTNPTLPQTRRTDLPISYWFGQGDIDINDYAQSQCYVDFYSRAKICEWLKLKPEFEIYAPRCNGTYSAAHLRRGDYVSNPSFRKLYCEVSEESYKQAIEKFSIPEPIFWVAEELAQPSPKLAELGVPWLSDFLILRDAAHLLRANSSFSWWAATLGHGKIYAPVVGTKVGLQHVDFCEGNFPNTAGVFPNQSDLFIKEQ